MPIFDYNCKCGNHKYDVYVAKHDTLIVCEKCSRTMQKLLSMPNFSLGPFGAYGRYDETLGCYISSKKQWREEMRKQNVTPRGDTPKL